MNGFNVAEFDAGLIYATPEIFLALAACAILTLDLFLSDAQRQWTGALAVVSLCVTALLAALQPVSGKITALGGLFELDRMAQVLKVVTLLTVAVVFVYSTDYLKRRAILKGEYYVLGLFATLGAMVLISAGSLITLFLGLELLSLCLYAMVAFDRDSVIAAESAIKYFVLGSMASGTLLYGMSIVYGVTGNLELAAIAAAVHGGISANVGLLFGIAFLIVGLGFKLGAVPFHMWIPDVYEGSPTCVTVFIGTASKLAAFALIMRVLPEALAASQPDWSQMLVVLAVLSMAIGSIVAIAQTNIKRANRPSVDLYRRRGGRCQFQQAGTDGQDHRDPRPHVPQYAARQTAVVAAGLSRYDARKHPLEELPGRLQTGGFRRQPLHQLALLLGLLRRQRVREHVPPAFLLVQGDGSQDSPRGHHGGRHLPVEGWPRSARHHERQHGA